jgi:hypothetical protein
MMEKIDQDNRTKSEAPPKRFRIKLFISLEANKCAQSKIHMEKRAKKRIDMHRQIPLQNSRIILDEFILFIINFLIFYNANLSDIFRRDSL